MKIFDVIFEAGKILEQNNIEDGRNKARRILSKITGKDKEFLMIHSDEELSDLHYADYMNKIERLKNHEPIQYILENQEFMGFDFYVNNNVLIPQPDTENLVEEVIRIVKAIKDESNKKEIKILDMCTGSGAIAISLSKLLENVNVYASDISQEALKVAEKNVKKNNANVMLLNSDLFQNISELYKFDIIVSNPPYIETEVIKNLSEEVKSEPIIALDGGTDGLMFYREIASYAKKYLTSGGILALEIGYNQKESVMEILEKNGYKNIYAKKDLAGLNRVIVGQL